MKKHLYNYSLKKTHVKLGVIKVRHCTQRNYVRSDERLQQFACVKKPISFFWRGININLNFSTHINPYSNKIKSLKPSFQG